MTTNPHTVTVTIDDGDTHVAFTCAGDEASPCHQYPDCECEDWGDDCNHQPLPHAECWMQAWFDAPCIAYVDESGEVDPGGPGSARSGPIKTSFEDDYVAWWWAE